MKDNSVIQAFHISVTPVGENKYLLRTERVPPAVPLAEDLVIWPVQDWLNCAAREGLSPSEGATGITAPEWVYLDYRWEDSRETPQRQKPLSPPALSHKLYNSLFQGNLGNSWITATETARAGGEILQVRLVLKEERLSSLPWKLVDLGEYLQTGLLEEEEEADFSELDSSEFGDWEMADEDMEDTDYEEDTAFVSGLLGQFSKVNSTNHNSTEVSTKFTELTTETNSAPPKTAAEPIANQSIPSDPPPTQVYVSDRTKIPANDFAAKLRNLTANFHQHDWPFSNKQLLLVSFSFLLFTSLSLVIGRNRWSQVGLRSASYLPEVSYTTPPAQPLPKKPSIDLSKTTSSKLAQMAIQHFRQGNLASGQRMVEVLLDRKALPQAKASLAAVPQQHRNNSAISFLYGRLAWQSVQAGDKNYTLDDARRYWETAVKGESKSPLYYNALGFAYYAQGNITRANQAWFNALYQAQEEQATKAELTNRVAAKNSMPNPAKFVTTKDALTAYAGLSLVLWRSSNNQPGLERSRLINKAIELRQKVMHDDSVNFQPQKLPTNWLWTKQAIQDWQTLQQIKN